MVNYIYTGAIPTNISNIVENLPLQGIGNYIYKGAIPNNISNMVEKQGSAEDQP